MNSTLIISGGSIENEFFEKHIENEKYNHIIAVDGGLKILDAFSIVPDYIVGDFDTIDPQILKKYKDRSDVNIKEFNPQKDFTDTFSAVNLAIELNSYRIVILGGIGSRMDHSLANIGLLHITLDAGIDTVIMNQNNTIRLLGKKRKSIDLQRKEDKKYVSLIPVSEMVTGVTTEGLKYNLDHYDFDRDKNISLGVSNELTGKTAHIEMNQGLLLVIESND